MLESSLSATRMKTPSPSPKKRVCIVELTNKNYPDGKYRGQCVQGKRSGEGTMIFSTGKVYSGQWCNDMMNGSGLCSWPSGSMYRGSYVNNKREGLGSYRWKSGDVYDGEWGNDKMNGKGVYTWRNREIFRGNYADNVRNGYGEHCWPDGRSYKGNWVDDVFQGHGDYRDAIGNHYEGQFLKGSKHGHGVFTWKNTTNFDGQFENDEVTSGTLIIKGICYTATFAKFVDRNNDDNVQLVDKKGLVVKGYFADGVFTCTAMFP